MMPTNNPYIGTLGMPKMWQQWFDALKEAGVDNLEVGPTFGVTAGGLSGQSRPSSFGYNQRTELRPLEPTFDPRYQSSAVSTAAPMVDKEGNFDGYNIQERRPQTMDSGRTYNPAFQGLRSYRGNR